MISKKAGACVLQGKPEGRIGRQKALEKLCKTGCKLWKTAVPEGKRQYLKARNPVPEGKKSCT
jgi:hypothetical protein